MIIAKIGSRRGVVSRIGVRVVVVVVFIHGTLSVPFAAAAVRQKGRVGCARFLECEEGLLCVVAQLYAVHGGSAGRLGGAVLEATLVRLRLTVPLALA